MNQHLDDCHEIGAAVVKVTKVDVNPDIAALKKKKSFSSKLFIFCVDFGVQYEKWS